MHRESDEFVSLHSQGKLYLPPVSHAGTRTQGYTCLSSSAR